MHTLIWYCSKQFLEPKDHPRFQYEYPKEKKWIELNISFGGFNHQVSKKKKNHKSPHFCRFLIGNQQYKKMFKFVAFMWPLWIIVILATTQLEM
jgi:hypothetical protein